jgi:hypothetical protein
MLEQQTGICERLRRLDRAIAELANPNTTAQPTSVVNRNVYGHGAHDPAPAPAKTLAPMQHPRTATMGNNTSTANMRRRPSCWPSFPPGKAHGQPQTQTAGPRGRRSIGSASRSYGNRQLQQRLVGLVSDRFTREPTRL